MVGGCHVKREQFLNLIFGYYDTYAEAGSDTNSPAGWVVKTMSVVPSDEIWVLQEVNLMNANRGMRVIAGIHDGSYWWTLIDEITGGTGYYAIWTGAVVMRHGDYLRVAFYDVIAGDDLYWQARGYKMKLNQ